MPKQNFKSHAKRKRQIAKLEKRQAKDQKRASRRADGTEAVADAPVASLVPTAPRGAAVAAQPKLTLAEQVERWKNTKIPKAKVRY